MKLNKCFFCNKLTVTPIHITEIHNEIVQSIDLCIMCAKEYLEPLDKKINNKKEKINLNQITTSEELINFISESFEKEIRNYKPPIKSCECGMTLDDFNKYGKFGCMKCYDYFDEIMKEIVFPYHNSSEHFGKIPKKKAEHEANKNPYEKLKLLKLRLAKEIEIENYEKASYINEEIKKFNQEFPTISLDQ